MYLKLFCRPLAAVTMSAGLLMSSLASTQAQELQWQRGAVRSDASTTGGNSTATHGGSSANHRFVAPTANRQASFDAPIQQPAQQLAQQRANQSRAKRPSTAQRRAPQARQALPAPADYRQASAAVDQAAVPENASGQLDFVSAVRDAAVRQAHVRNQAEGASAVTPAQFACGDGQCLCGSCPEPGCGVFEPGCGFPEPGCGVYDPGCAVAEPGCGFIAEPEVCGAPVCGDCMCGDVACCGDCVGGPCPPHSWGGCSERGAIPICIYLPPIKEIILFGGVHGFKSPLDNSPTRRDAGNFGFQAGVNAGGRMSWLPWPGLGFQLGYQTLHSQLDGSFLGGSSGSNNQNFFTMGLFRRRPVGVQYGVVYDFLQDDRQGSTDFNQVRGLISTTSTCGHEFGFQFAARGGDSVVTNLGMSASFKPRDQYLFFYRYHGQTGGEFRWFIGGDDDDHTILGGDLNAPLNERWSIQTGFTYFIPGGTGAGVSKADEEGWNLGTNLVWHFGARGRQYYKSPWRPMFNVADNGSMFIDDVD